MEKETYYKAAIIILLIALAAVIIQNQMIVSKQDENTESSNVTGITGEEQKTQHEAESEILKKLKQFPELKPYENNTAEITILTDENLTELAKKQPVIYEDIKLGTYRIVFKSDSIGLIR